MPIRYIRRKINIMKAVASATYKEWAAYRTHSMISILTGPLYFLVQAAIWTAVYSGQDSINGMRLEQMITYYAVSALIGYLTMDFADWNLQMLLRTGKFLTYALRPMDHRFFAFSQKIGHRLLGLIFEFLPVLLLFMLFFRVDLRPESWVLGIASVVLSFLLTFYINYCIGLLGFWLTKTNGLRGVVQLVTSICSGAIIPLVFFPEAIQKIMFYVPFQFMTYVPSMVFTGNYELGGQTMGLTQIVLMQALYTVLIACLSEVLYRLGMKRFTGVGA